MTRHSLIVILGSMFLLSAGTARAQDPFGPAEGTRIRFSAPPLGLHGETGTVDLSGRGGMVVVLDDGERVKVPYPALARVEVSRGERKAIGWGVVAGAMVGVTAVVAASQPTWDEWSEYGDDGLDEGSLFLGAVTGAVIGGMIGSAITYESWRPVPWVRFAGYDREPVAGLAITMPLDSDGR